MRRAEHFLVINLPSPAGAQRYLKLGDLRVAVDLDRGAQNFNFHLTGLKEGFYYDLSDNVTLVDMYAFVDEVNNHLDTYRLVNSSQPPGVRVDYGTFGEGGGDTSVRRRIATSDDAHPTEAVYKLMGKHIAQALRQDYSLGRLGTSHLL